MRIKLQALWILSIMMASCQPIVKEDLGHINFADQLTVEYQQFDESHFTFMFDKYIDSIGIAEGGLDFAHLSDTTKNEKVFLRIQPMSNFDKKHPNPQSCTEICIAHPDTIRISGIHVTEMELKDFIQSHFDESAKNSYPNDFARTLCFRVQFGKCYKTDKLTSISIAYKIIDQLIIKWNEVRMIIGRKVFGKNWQEMLPWEKELVSSEYMPMSIYLTNANELCSMSLLYY